jgi:hypothetical protein
MRFSKNYFFKVIALTIIVLLLDSVIRYILMQTHLLSVRPFSAVTGGESHFYNISKAFVWNLVMVGWCYLVYIVISSIIYYRYPTSFWWLYIRNLLVYIALSTVYVLLSGANREELIIENIIASVPLTYLVSVLDKNWLFKRPVETQ